MPTENFKSKEAYRRNLAYRHIHGVPMTATRVCIRGEGCHKVDHSRETPARRRINARQRRKVAARQRRQSLHPLHLRQSHHHRRSQSR